MNECAAFILPEKKGFYLDPRTKIFLMAVITTLLIYEHERVAFMSIAAFIPCILLIANKQRLTAIVYGSLIIIAIALKLTQDIVVLPKILNTLSLLFKAFILRLMPIFMMGEYIIKSTSAGEFVAAMQRMKLTDKFIIPVSVTFRFLPTIAEEFKAISYAMKMREISFGTKRFRKNPGLFLEYRIIPLMISIAKIGEELSAAALTKGLGSKKERHSIAAIGFGGNDLVAFIFIFGLIVQVVLI